MSKILVITPRWPFPVIGGDRLRIYHLCKELAKNHELTLVSLCDEKADMCVEADDVFSESYRIFQPKWRSWINSFIAIFSGEPLQVAYYRSSALARLVDNLLSQHDAAFCHLIRTAEYVKNKNIPKFLEMTDAISLNYSRIAAAKSRQWSLKELIFAFESKRLAGYERRIVECFDLTVLVSDKDRQFLFDEPRPDVLVCSNGVDISRLPYQDRAGQGLGIAFIGNMRTVQNIDSCRYFVSEILPTLRQQAPFFFRIIGTIPEQLAAEFSCIDGVEVTGKVDSVAHAASGCFVGVCPMRLGAGVQNKVLEYMALGLPAITSPLGYEGFSAQPGNDLLIADSNQEWVDTILWLASDKLEAQRIGRNGRLYVEGNHCWETMLMPFVDGIDTSLAASVVTFETGDKEDYQ